ncbi:LANO_0E09120g1_1 [Lachancea nothofagi CBS 11611]|uniref:LANO_0E09120g1_1 n=1 Tax=Lachancea nothofagi CBS 11611 TaxID=1266666 RepID=A0A1G4JVI7_9SACH|nr:LANO_0E09120g1_1 [Lachancea nothofagi CBS 11611]
MTHPVISLKPSYNSIIRGCPGLPETLPRLECELRVRSSDGGEFYIEGMEVVLKTTEALNSSGHTFSSRTKIEKTVVHYKKNVKVSSKKLVGIDIPLTISVPDDIKETNYNPRFGHCFTTLECRATYFTIAGNPLMETFTTAVNVERYDILASSKHSQPLSRTYHSPDKKVQVKYEVRNPCITSDDLLHLKLNIIPSLSSGAFKSSPMKINKKLKLKAVTFEIKELLETYDSHHDSKENIIHTVVKSFNEVITKSGTQFETNVRVMTKNLQFKQYEMSLNEPAVLFKLPAHPPVLAEPPPETVLLKSKKELEPFHYHSSITTRGKLFSITHGVTIKFKIGNAKDFEIHQPIDISPWVLPQLKHIENVVAREREIAKNARSFYESFGGIRRRKSSGELEYPPLPPVVYLADKQTLKQLGIQYDTSFKTPKRILVIE